MKNNLYFILIFFPLIVFSNDWVFSLKDSLYYESDMYSFYGINEWKRSSPEKKKIMVKDYIIRETAYHQGLEGGLNLSPSFFEKSFNRERELLVNYVYKMEVARLAADSSRVVLGNDFLKEDLLVHHILFGHNEASLRVPIERSKEEAFKLCSSVLDTLLVENFSSTAKLYSDDGGVKLNGGRVGWLSWGSTPSPSFETAVFSSKLNLFGPVETEFGYHIAYIEERRPSSFSFLPETEYNDMVLIRACPRDLGTLKQTSSVFDSLTIEKNGLVFNHDMVLSVFSSFTNNKSSVSSYEKNNIVALLESINERGVLCLYNGEGYGLSWFLQKLKNFSPSNRPPITNIESFYSMLRTLLLQESAYSFGVENNYNKRDIFKKQLLSFKKDLMYGVYFKNIVNNVSKPDSLSVLNYYNLNKDIKYKTPKSLKLQEIEVATWDKADLVLNKYIEGESFEFLSENFSISWDDNKKGAVGPIEKGFKGGALKDLFMEEEGFVSDVYKNDSGTYSIYLIKKIYPSSYIAYEKVFSRISSFLHKESQEKAKEAAINTFYKNLNITINESAF